ncbi:YbaB/EbfC family nucleoid-associated protein [Actinomadura vinacea]
MQQRDLAADRIMRLERQMRVTADAVDEFATRVRHLDSSLAKKGVVQGIEPGLGAVIVDGNGELQDVKFNVDDVRTTDPARLGDRVLCAINEAKDKIQLIREHGLRDISKSVNRK